MIIIFLVMLCTQAPRILTGLWREVVTKNVEAVVAAWQRASRTQALPLVVTQTLDEFISVALNDGCLRARVDLVREKPYGSMVTGDWVYVTASTITYAHRKIVYRSTKTGVLLSTTAHACERTWVENQAKGMAHELRSKGITACWVRDEFERVIDPPAR
ncbi:MAG: hypothetical protein JWN18_181 [Parcubacteria group bacterium]|nr:hypothetical protein [Parcubacteria group bacterium]